jgi:hypothetical protein
VVALGRSSVGGERVATAAAVSELHGVIKEEVLVLEKVHYPGCRLGMQTVPAKSFSAAFLRQFP